MAARPDCILEGTIIRPKTVVTTAVAKGRVVSWNTSDSQGVHTAAAAAGDGIALEAGNVGDSIPVVPLAGNKGVVPVLVGTGGATRGQAAVVVADGVTNSGTLGAGTVLKNIVGYFTQSGVAGDWVGLALEKSASVSA